MTWKRRKNNGSGRRKVNRGYSSLCRAFMKTQQELGERIAWGRTADIHSWNDSQIVKLYQPWIGLRAVESEQRKTAVAVAAGLPVPAVGEVVQVGERIGLLFERVVGPSMMALIIQGQTSLEDSATQLADLHLSLHHAEAPGEFPCQADHIRARILATPILSSAERAASLEVLDQMPRGNSLCHGDFHPGNILVTDRGPVIIDWVDASRGDPICDLARTMLLFLGHLEANPVSDGERIAMQRYHDTYLSRYELAVPGARAMFQNWLPVLAAARLNERIEEQNAWLHSLVRKGFSLDFSR